MKFLLTNDDGADAPGLRALLEAVKGLGEAVIMAPAGAISGCSHSVTTDRPFRLIERNQSEYVVEGTPADCVRVALHKFGEQFDWVLSGINNGGNLGTDVYHSGTVAAVREAALRGLPGIAVSHYHDRLLTDDDWKRAASWTKPILQKLFAGEVTENVFWNINLPSLDGEAQEPEIVFCPLDSSPLPLSFKQNSNTLLYNGRYAHRKRKPGSDVDVCFSGKIAVTKVSVMESC